MTSGRERGSLTVLTVGALGAVVLVLTGVLAATGTVRDVHRVRAAADLAALAAAGPVASGGGPDCRVAQTVAAANGAMLTRCDPEPDGSVVVAVEVARHWPPAWGVLPGSVSARARAGVVDAVSGTPRPVVRSWHPPQ